MLSSHLRQGWRRNVPAVRPDSLTDWYSDHSGVILLRCWGDRLERLKTQLQLAEVDILTININRPNQIITFKGCLLSADISYNSANIWAFVSSMFFITTLVPLGQVSIIMSFYECSTGVIRSLSSWLPRIKLSDPSSSVTVLTNCISSELFIDSSAKLTLGQSAYLQADYFDLCILKI